MPNTRISIPSLFGGVSQQAAALRHPNQVASADNVYLSVSDGMSKRNGTTHFGSAITDLTAAGNYRLHAINRDGDEQYLIAYGDSTLRFFDVVNSGIEVEKKISTDAQTYLDANSATADDMRLISSNDYTILVNRTVESDSSDSDAYTVTDEHDDYEEMTRKTPAVNTYHRTKTDSNGRTAGYWKYVPGATPATLALPTYNRAGSPDYGDVATWKASSRNPGGFKITFTKTDSSTVTYDVVWNMEDDSSITKMRHVADAITRALQNAGAKNAQCRWQWVSQGTAKFIITSPYGGAGATFGANCITSPTDGNVFDFSGSGFPFYTGGGSDVVTAGTGDAAAFVENIVDRWVRVPAPSQKDAKLDASTMPIQIVRRFNDYYLGSQFSGGVYFTTGAFAHWPFEELAGTTADNYLGNATYDATYTSGYTLGTYMVPNVRGVTLNGTTATIDIPALGSWGTAIASGMSVEFWVKRATTGAVGMVADLGDGGGNVWMQISITAADKLRLRWADAASHVLDASTTSAAGVVDDAPHHVVVTAKPSTRAVQIYVDGVSLPVTYASQDLLDTFASIAFSSVVGKNRVGSEYFNGTIGGLALYTTVLNSDQVLNHYARGLGEAWAESSTYFDVDVIDWKFRETGDTDTNPLPSFVGNTIRDIVFHRNRLAIGADDNVVFSQAGDFFNFFIEDANNLVDSDPIDVAIASDEVAIVDSLTPFRKSLVIFTRAGRQFELNAPETLSPTTAAITPSTSYDSMDVKPAVLENQLYFAADQVGAGGQVYEYFYDDSITSSTAANITAHCDRYLPSDIRTIQTGLNTNTVIALPTDASSLYVYRYFWRGNEKVQSAWSRITLDDDDRIADVAVIRDFAYLLVEEYPGYFVFMRLALAKDGAADGMPYAPHIDHMVSKTGTFSSTTTTFTLGFNDDKIDVIVTGPDFPDISNPTAFGTGTTGVLAQQAVRSAISPDGNYIAFALSTSPYIAVYTWTKSGGIGTKLPDPASDPGNPVFDVAWHPDGDLLAAVTGGSLMAYKFTSAGLGRKITAASTPTATCAGVAWSPNGSYVAVATSGSPYVEVWAWTADRFGSKFSNPGTLPTGAGKNVAWHPDSTYIAVAHTTTPYITAYPFTSSGFGSKLTNPVTLPTGNATDVAWNYNGTAIAVSHATSPYVTAYPFTTVFGTKYSNPSSLPSGNGQAVAWHPDGRGVYLGVASTPYLEAWRFSGGWSTKFTAPSITPAAAVTSIVVDPGGKRIALTYNTTPFATSHSITGTTTTPGTVLSGNPGSTAGTVTITGDYSAFACYLGRTFDMVAELSRPYQRDQNNQTVIDGKLQLDKLALVHRNTAAYTVRISQAGTTRDYTFTPRDTTVDIENEGTFFAFPQGFNDTATITLRNSSPKPATIVAADIIGTFTPGTQ